MTVPGFRRKEFRGKLAIAITANFKNMRTTAEATVDEISGVAFVYKQDFFNNLYDEFGIALENIVYYKVKVDVECRIVDVDVECKCSRYK